RLGQLVVAELDPERTDDRHRRNGAAGERLLRTSERREVVRRHLPVEPERLLPGADRLRVVAARPPPRLHGESLFADLGEEHDLAVANEEVDGAALAASALAAAARAARARTARRPRSRAGRS